MSAGELDSADETLPEVARSAIQAVIAAQEALRKDPGRATEVGRKLFPATEATDGATHRDRATFTGDTVPLAHGWTHSK